MKLTLTRLVAVWDARYCHRPQGIDGPSRRLMVGAIEVARVVKSVREGEPTLYFAWVGRSNLAQGYRNEETAMRKCEKAIGWKDRK